MADLWRRAWRRFVPCRPTSIGATAFRVVICLFVAAAVSVQTRTPRADGDWQPQLAVAPRVLPLADDAYLIDPIRDWTYSATEPLTTDLVAGVFAPDEVRRAWFVLEPFARSAAIAHTLVLFEFTDDRLLALTIEPRKEVGERFSFSVGLFNEFELIYVWASARDLLLRRALYLDRDVYVFPLAFSQVETERFFLSLLDQTEGVRRRPRFYNTLSTNCTSELARAADLDWDLSFVVTGRSARSLFRRGLIANAETYAEAKTRADAGAAVLALQGLPSEAFDAALLAALRARLAAGP